MNYFPFSVGYVKGPPTPPVIAVNKPWHYVLFQLHSEDDGYILPTLTVNLTFHVSYLSLCIKVLFFCMPQLTISTVNAFESVSQDKNPFFFLLLFPI